MQTLLNEIRSCELCKHKLPLGPNPVLRAHPDSKVLIVGQAPGTRVHNTGIPWNDPSGDRLRDWMNISREEFYDEKIHAIVPMGFCYPGTGKSGDLPPMPECAKTWHIPLLKYMPKLELVLLIGKYAQNHYLGKKQKKNLTETVRNFHEYIPKYLPLPHPSPRNNIWLKKNPWFEKDLIPVLRDLLKAI